MSAANPWDRARFNPGVRCAHPWACNSPSLLQQYIWRQRGLRGECLMNPYDSLCDDFGIFAYVNTKMELPSGRETVLHFFNSLQKTFPTMTDFDCRGGNEYVLEEDREQGSYRWIGLELKRFASGYVNPPSVEAADAQHER